MLRAIKNIEQYDLMGTVVPREVRVYLWGAWEPVWGGGVWAGDWTVEGGLRVSKWPGEEDGLSRPVYRGRVWRTEVRGDLQADLGSQIRNKSSEFRFYDSYNTYTHTHTHTHTHTFQRALRQNYTFKRFWHLLSQQFNISVQEHGARKV